VSLVNRFAGPAIDALIDDEAVVIVQGPRACGKTTLVQQLAARRGRDLLDVGQPSDFAVARQDPAAYLSGRPEPVFIDEFQRVPDLLAVIKRSVDTSPRSGAFVLTGSTTQDLLPKGSETLAGRSVVTTMWGFSQGELLGTTEQFIDRLFDSPDSLMVVAIRLLQVGGDGRVPRSCATDAGRRPTQMATRVRGAGRRPRPRRTGPITPPWRLPLGS
jgi:uncharacterized protein